MTAQSTKRRKGIQLVETLVAGTIFFVMAAVFLNLLPAATWATKKSDNRLAALNVSRNIVEQIRQEPFADLDSKYPTTEVLTVNGTKFEARTTIQDVPESNSEFLKEIIVVLHWNESRTTKSYTHRTYVSRIKP